MTPAPALDCAACHRRIGEAAGHVLLNRDRPVIERQLVCTRYAGDREVHGRFHPECPDQSHLVLDHPVSTGTRAGAARVLGAGRSPRHPVLRMPRPERILSASWEAFRGGCC
jgi:hypothetical protein